MPDSEAFRECNNDKFNLIGLSSISFIFLFGGDGRGPSHTFLSICFPRFCLCAITYLGVRLHIIITNAQVAHLVVRSRKK